MISNYFIPSLRWASFPQEVVIEVTNHCNLACIMCPHSSMKRDKGIMDKSLYVKIIDEICGKTELVYLYGTGESLIHPQIYEFIDYAHSKGLYTVLSTNGLLMDQKASKKLLASKLDYLIIALDGGVKQTYESIRIGGNFDLLITNIKEFLNEKIKYNSSLNTCLQMIYMEKNAHEKELFKKLFSKSEKAQINQFRFKPLYETYNLKDNQVHHTRPCYWLWNLMSIYWNGDVALCCMDSDAAYNLGSVKKNSVREIWKDKQIDNIRRRHKTIDYGDMPLCNTCDMPEQGYFTPLTIASSVAFSAKSIRKIIPLYEKYILIKK